MTLRIYEPGDDPATLFGANADLVAAAWLEFDCDPLPSSGRGDAASRRRAEKRAAKRQQVTDRSLAFVRAMQSDNPPATEEQAVKFLVGGWLMSWLFQQLAVQVIKWLWRRWHEPEQFNGKPQASA